MSKFSDYLKSQEYLDYLKLMDDSKFEFEKQSKFFFDSLAYDDQLKVFYHVVKNVYEGCIVEKGSYRHVIYNKFNFGPDSYGLGMDCGLLDLNNSIYTRKDISESLSSILKFLNVELDNHTFNKLVSRFEYGYFDSYSHNRSIQLCMNFDDNTSIG